MASEPYEMVRLRPGADIHENMRGRWKVTARYRVDTGKGDPLHCVRVRHGVGPVYHFTAERFAELFENELADAHEAEARGEGR